MANISWTGRKYNDDEYDNTLRAPFDSLERIIRDPSKIFIPVTERVFTLECSLITSIHGIDYWFRPGTYTIHSAKVVYIPKGP
jgi:hypothetical protein